MTHHEPTSPDDTFYGSDFGALQAFDPDIAGVLLSELGRIRGGLQLIASENMSSPEVLTALGSTLSNKYAEGYPGRRYYGGCAEVDKAETIAIERCKALFDAEHANVQPHSGASANQAVYGAFMQPGDTFLAMALPMGGHLTHGAKVSFSGKWFNAVHYGVDRETEDIDYDQVARAGPRAPAQGHPRRRQRDPAAHRLRVLPQPRRRGRRDLLGRRRALHRPRRRQGDPQPVPYADVVTFTTHKVLRGPRSGALVSKAEHAAALDRAVFPMMQGGPQMHTIAAKAVNFKECATPEYAEYARRVVENARQLATSPGRVRHPADDRRHRHPPVAARPPGGRRHRCRRRGPRRRRRDRPQQERDPVRPAEGQHRLGHPRRHPVARRPRGWAPRR